MKLLFAFLFGLCSLQCVAASMKTDTLSFVLDGRRFRGLLDQPAEQPAAGLILIIPGSGKTDIEHWKWMRTIRANFVSAGFACYIWDKAGCGKSEGTFDGSEPFRPSVDEAIAAIGALKQRNISGSEHIGLWGLSRGGWICPLIISEYPAIRFWISVSGPDDKENSAYLLETNFRIEGRSKEQTTDLINAWYANYETVRHGKTFEENQKATENLRRDPFYVSLGDGSKPSREGYLRWQNSFEDGTNFPFDEETCVLIYFPGFDSVLRKINCPVLAIFGEKDSQVDWQKTKKRYSNTIGLNPKASLTIKTFPDGNHIIRKCNTGGLREQLEDF